MGEAGSQGAEPRIGRDRSLCAPADVLDLVLRTLDDSQAEAVATIDLEGKTAIADYMVIACGRSSRHIVALAEKLVQALKARGWRQVPVEGMAHAEWVLVDAGDVIVHIFKPETRRFYNLEKMWGVAMPEPERAAELIA